MGLFGPPNVTRLAEKKNVKGLIKALSYTNDNNYALTSTIQEEATEALGQIGDALAVEPLIAVLEEGGSSLCKKAVKALGQIGDARAVEPLIDVLKHRVYIDNSLRIAAAEALGEIGDARSDKPLIDILMDPKLAPESVERKAVVKALLEGGRVTMEQIDEISKPYVTQYRADMEAIVEQYEAKVDDAYSKHYGGKPKKKFDIESYYKKFKTESVEFLSSKLFSYRPSDSEKMASCLALGKIATTEAREALGFVFSREFPRNDQIPVMNGHNVLGVASQVLRRLGPPVPDSLIEAIAAPHIYMESEQRGIDRLLVAIGGTDLDDRLTEFLKRQVSDKEKIADRIRQIKMELALARRAI